MCTERCRCPKIGCCSFLLVEWCQGMSVRWNVQSFFPVAAADTQTVLVALFEAEDWLLLAGVAPSSDGHIPFLVIYQPAAFSGIFSLNLQWKCLVFSWHIGGSTVVFPYMGAAFSRLCFDSLEHKEESSLSLAGLLSLFRIIFFSCFDASTEALPFSDKR